MVVSLHVISPAVVIFLNIINDLIKGQVLDLDFLLHGWHMFISAHLMASLYIY